MYRDTLPFGQPMQFLKMLQITHNYGFYCNISYQKRAHIYSWVRVKIGILQICPYYVTKGRGTVMSFKSYLIYPLAFRQGFSQIIFKLYPH